MTELEKKLLLTEDEYDYLMEHLGYESPLIQKPITTQVNYYFDTDDFSMNRQNTTCRIRLKDGKYKATMKKHTSGSDQSTETEMEIYNGLENNAFTEMGLKLQGELVTNRCVVFKDANCEAVLDKNEYLGQTDYELEIEYKHKQEAITVFNFFKELLLKQTYFRANPKRFWNETKIPSKSSRFFERRIRMEKKQNITNSFDAHCNTSAKYIEEHPYSETYEPYLYYQNPDEYLYEHYYPAEYDEQTCLSCIHWNGTICDKKYGECEYEHY